MSPLAKTWRLALLDLRLTLRDRAALFWMLLLPVAFMWLFSNLGGGGDGGPPKIHLTVEDHDGGWLARALVAELDDERLQLVEKTPADEAADAAAGDAETPETDEEAPLRVLVIPEGFTAGALAGEQQTLELASRGGANQQYTVAAQMHLVRVIARLLGRLVELRALSESEADDELDDEALRIGMERLATRPVLVQVHASDAGRGTPVIQGRAQSIPGTLTGIVLMMTMIYGGVFLAQEKVTGTLRRQAALPIRPGQIFAGKVLGRLLIAGLQIVVLVVVGRFVFGLSWGTSPVGLTLVLASYAVAVAGIATLLGAWVSTPDQASGIGWIGSMVMASLGGCWWPAEVMPHWLRVVAHAVPTAWAMDALHALISFGRGVDAVILPSAVLLAFGIASSMLGARLLRFD
ncbi:MAG: ABC transporter permease [Acidobacteria bacterium]|nr:ABC transporter permease [Acidobacteriota bacterium]